MCAGGREIDGSIAIERARDSLLNRSDRPCTTVNYTGPDERLLDIKLDANRLSLPEIGRYFRPLAAIKLEPAVDVRAKGTLDALNMDVNVVSAAGTASGPLVGHFGSDRKSLEGRLDVRNVDMAPILNRSEWKTRVTGQADFKWTFSPALINFVRRTAVRGWYQDANARAQGFQHGNSVRCERGCVRGPVQPECTFRFAAAAPALVFLAGLPEATGGVCRAAAMPKLETRAVGRYQFERAAAIGAEMRSERVLGRSARLGQGKQLAIQVAHRALSYSQGASRLLNPRRFARRSISSGSTTIGSARS